MAGEQPGPADGETAGDTADDGADRIAQRRTEIAEATIRIIARAGLRGLGQRAVDHEIGWAPGTTSYYARTERQLVQLAVRQLAGRTAADVDRPVRVGSVDDATRRLVAVLDAVAGRETDARARLVLSLELVGDPELHARVTHASPVREQLLAGASRLLAELGLPSGAAPAADLVALLNGLLLDRLAGPGVEPAHRARADVLIRAHLTGLAADSK